MSDKQFSILVMELFRELSSLVAKETFGYHLRRDGNTYCDASKCQPKVRCIKGII